MESIRELRKRCQSVHSDDVSAQIVRSVSIYFTRVLIPTGISANVVSVANVGVGIGAGVAFAFGAPIGALLGLALFTLNTILDGVDGEVARYRRQSSLTGLFLDRVNSFFAYPWVFGGTGIALSLEHDSPVPLIVAMVAAWATTALRLVRSTVDTTIVDGLTQEKAAQEAESPKPPEDVKPLAEIIRFRSRLAWLVDFVLFRQPGFNIVLILGWVSSGLVPSEACGVMCEPLFYLIGGYGLAYVGAVAAGLLVITRQRRPEIGIADVRRRVTRSTGS